ncbi:MULTISPECIES: tautomerase family protein [unclassified Streptomyces]|jgi:4-oxalocrotonate tautomerase|uniref:tautomerase family protein n=1 Tax=unclassified Streptomyces TaxID=2593676 RepID=UPI003404EB30
MPFIDVKIYDRRLTPQTERALIERLTQATVDVFGEEIREQTWIALTGVPPQRWGIAGEPGA